MKDDQRTVGGTQKTVPADAEAARTQIAGSSTPPPPKAPGEARWPPPSAAPFRPPPPPTGAPPESSGTETVVMEVEPKAKMPLAWLAVVEGPGAKRGKLVQLGAETIVGRKEGDLTLGGDHGVSGQHIKIRLEIKEDAPEGAQVFVLYDMASRNGTYVGNRDTYQEESSRTYRCELHDGDYVLLGETILVFKEVA